MNSKFLDMCFQVWQFENTPGEFAEFSGWCFTWWWIFEYNKKCRSGLIFSQRDHILFGLILFFSSFISLLTFLLYVNLFPEICCILSPFDLWPCNYCCKCCLHLQVNVFAIKWERLCSYWCCPYFWIWSHLPVLFLSIQQTRTKL